MKLAKTLLALAIAAGAFLATTGTAWALPCARGERLVGSTETAWICQNISTGALRLVEK